MTEWQCSGPHPTWSSDRLRLALEPARGLVDVRLEPEGVQLPQLLGVEIVDAVGLGPRPLVEPGTTPEVVCRQDIVLAIYKPTPARPVECHARWRVNGDRLFDLEVSTLTPGQWGGLSVRTRSTLPGGAIISQTDAPVLIHRLGVLSYLEMCHPNDTTGFDLLPEGVVRFRLFGHDLEKGVILRGRLRGMVVERRNDEETARKAYQRFLAEPPHLSV